MRLDFADVLDHPFFELVHEEDLRGQAVLAGECGEVALDGVHVLGGDGADGNARGQLEAAGRELGVEGEVDEGLGEEGFEQARLGEGVRVKGVDVFHPNTGEVRSDGPDGIACWFIDTDYNQESFFVRHAYFLGQNDPYKALKTTLKAEIDEEAWETLHSAESRPFDKPESGRIAVKVINHLGDEVMKVFRVE